MTASSSFAPIRRLGHNGRHHFFGYYNKTVWDRSGRYVLGNQVAMMDARLTPELEAQVGYFDPTLFTLQESILIVAYVVFGGMGSLPGAMAGAAALTWLPQFLKAQVPANDRPMWVGAAILAMMIFRPAGLLPAKRRKAELEGLDSPASSETMAVPASEGL